MEVAITGYSPEYQKAIRRMLERIGWTDQYIIAAEKNAETLSGKPIGSDKPIGSRLECWRGQFVSPLVG